MDLNEGGATSFEMEGNLLYVYTNFTDFGAMNTKLEELGVEPKNAEIQRIAQNTVELPVEDAKNIFELIEKFEDDECV